MQLGIPRKMAHIWIGHREPPLDWMQSWKDMHPNWDYVLYDNDYLFSRRFRTQALINEYFRRGQYAGVADLLRYEILLDEGGFIAPADAVCRRPVDELLAAPALYTVYENEVKKPGMVSPFLAGTQGHPFLSVIIKQLIQKYTVRCEPSKLSDPWISVGNRFLKISLKTRKPENILIFPSHYCIPQHKTGQRYSGTDPVYADEYWGSTFGIYKEPEDVDIEGLKANLCMRLAQP